MDRMIKLQVSYEVSKKIPQSFTELTVEELDSLISMEGTLGMQVMLKIASGELEDASKKVDALAGATSYDQGVISGAREMLIRYANIIEFAKAEKKFRANKPKPIEELTNL